MKISQIFSKQVVFSILLIVSLFSIAIIAQQKEFRLSIGTWKEQSVDLTVPVAHTPSGYQSLYKLTSGNWKSLDSAGVLTSLNDNQHPQYAKVKSVTLAASAATLNMTDADMVLVTADGGGNTITSITGAAPGRTIKIQFVGTGASITDQTNIQLAGGTTITGAANKVVVFTCFTGTVWQEQSVSAN